jgi:NAD(P)H-dependent flavin oxidoreductase YrpB (nitropropane dioxygenase family)
MISIRTVLCDLLGCQFPIIQTGMGRVATPVLAAAASNAGGFGFIGAATLAPEQVEPAILQAQRLTAKPFGINFQMMQPGAAHVVDMAVKHRVRAAVYSRAPNPEFVARLKGAGIICLPTVATVRQAVKAVAMGADAITVQGAEGGGHTGSVPTSILLPQVLDAVAVPVVAAGGFADGRGLAAALAYGAAGIAMGTRFLMTKESPVPPATLRRYLDEKDPARIIISTKVDGLRQRVIVNRLVTELERAGSLKLLYYAVKSALAYRRETGASLATLLRSALHLLNADSLTVAQTMMAANAPMMLQKSLVEGLPDAGILPAGQVAGTIDAILSCEQLINDIVAQAQERLLQLCR